MSESELIPNVPELFPADRLSQIQSNVKKVQDLQKDMQLIQKDIQLLDTINKALVLDTYLDLGLSKNDTFDLQTGVITRVPKDAEEQNGQS